MSLHKEINDKIHGRLAITIDETDMLYKYADRPGIHLEIGTLWGGTAIVAALAKRKHGNGSMVITIDFMKGGYWEHGDPGCKLECPTQNIIKQNLKKFDVFDLVAVIKAESNPLPIEASIKPVTVLIDAGHTYEACLADWNNIKALKPKFVIFHDYNTGKHPGVQRVVDEVVKNDNQWQEVELVNTMIVFKAK